MSTPDRTAPAAPETVTLFRNGYPESHHRVSAVVADAAGRVLHAWGDADATVFPRSALKPLQALPLLESGAADAFAVSDEELALAIASHNGLPMHVERVAAWLARLGLSTDDLECGAHPPFDAGATKSLYHDHAEPNPLHNNCSGKHTGMLATCLHLGLPTAGYSRPEHPLQQRILEVYAETTGTPAAAMPQGIDGCSLPAAAMPLAGLARAMARFAAPDDHFAADRAAAARRICRAWATHPELVAGPSTFNTDAMTLTGGRALLKRGAQGVYGGLVPDLGLGLAIKAESGSSIAADAMTAVVLRVLGVADETIWRRMTDLPYFKETSWRGLPAGEYRPVEGWPG
ncbi:L-asparaginase II [Caenispirillum salinarum AK4]|uniref:L-asparaginase II n=1 Tax=Caenispirillum salinarum AK4 TaxID=1238182 RepID=K9GX66_9PROT|nr:asparaginase [Caenispirillum salinarum]EKV30560.1 L-asparaginase II [Caenispirillum salinarum AK4]